MTIEDILNFFVALSDRPMATLGALSIIVFLLIVTSYLKSYYSKKGKLHANNQELKTQHNIPTNSSISPYWDSLSPTLQDAFLLAATKASREAKDRISTRDFFASLNRIRPLDLTPLLERLPPNALPEPVSPEVTVDPIQISNILQYSSCVNESLDQLAKEKGASQLTSRDMFVDIAKYGKGASVQRLRTYGVDEKVIDGIVKQLGWKLVERKT